MAKGFIKLADGEKTLERKVSAAETGARTNEFDLEIEPEDFERLSPPSRWRLSHLMYAVAAVAVLLWLGMLIADSVLAVVLVVIAVVIMLFVGAMGVFMILAWGLTTKQDALLHILAIAAERGMPLAPAVAAFADQYRGFAHRRIMHMAARLNWGAPLPDALEGARSLVTRDATLLAWVGEAAGRLPKALRKAADTRSSQLPVWTSIAARLAYILVVMLGLEVVSGFVLYYVVPRLESIYSDFNIALPDVTIMVVKASQYLVIFGPFTSLVPLAQVALLIFLPFSFLGWGNYSVPVFDRLLGRRHTALVLRSLSLIVEGGKPISLGLGVLADHYPAFWFRRKLRGTNSYVRGGVGWIEALLRHRVINAADSAVLTSAESVGNLAWALEELAETAERRLASRVQLVVQTFFPLVIVILGIVVFILATAYFLPLVRLIQNLT